MEIFKRRPLALASFFFLLVLILSFFVTLKYKLIAAAVLALSLVVFLVLFFIRKRSRNAILAVLLSLLFSLSAIWASYRAFDLGFFGHQDLVGTEGVISARVEKVNYRAEHLSYLVVDVSELNGKAVSTKMRLECAYGFPYEVGEEFSAAVVFSALEENINGYPEKMIGISKGMSLVAYSESVENVVYLGKGDFDVFLFAESLCMRLDSVLKEAIGEERSGISRAILLANKDALSSEAERDIRYVGVSHLLALSGMHLTILIGNIEKLLVLLCMPKRPRIALLALLTAVYVVLTGMQLSMVRASLMLLFAYIAFVLGRERDMMTALFFSVAIICFVTPGAVFDIGLELSFLSMIGLVAFQDTLSNYFDKIFEKIKPKFLNQILCYVCFSFSVTFVAVISVLPIMWFYFGETSLVAMLGNLLLSPFADLILMLSPLVIIFFRVPLLGVGIASVTGFLSDMMLFICSSLAKNDGVMLSLRYPFAVYVIMATVAVLFVMLIIKIEHKWHFLIPVTAGVLAFVLCLGVYTHINSDRLRIVCVSDGYNDGFVAVSDGEALVCDVSSGAYSFNVGLFQRARELAVCDIEVYMLTHIHARHAVSFDRLSDEIYVRNLWIPSPGTDDEIETVQTLLEIAEEKGIAVYIYDSFGQNEIPFEGIEVDTLPLSSLGRSVHPVVALSFHNGSSRLSYIGAASNESEIYFDALAIAGDSDALVFGCHGPKIKTKYSYGKLAEKLEFALFFGDDTLEYADLDEKDFAYSLESAESISGEGAYLVVLD